MLARDFSWQSRAECERDCLDSLAFIDVVENFVRARDVVIGYCDYCNEVGDFKVDAGPNFGTGYPNLREGLVCNCGAKNRDRLMLLAVEAQIAPQDGVLMFGSHGRLAEWLRERHPSTHFCEYLGAESPRGASVDVATGTIYNEDISNMSLPDRSVDVLIHCDVLEHVPRIELAASESYRVLKRGGRTIFTMPFFQNCDATVVRATQSSDGKVTHLLPPELHGDPLTPEGILAYYNFGWDVLGHFSRAGFKQPRVHMIYDVFRGLLSTGCPVPSMNMLPIYCEAIRD